jgi:hypothetical protein
MCLYVCVCLQAFSDDDTRAWAQEASRKAQDLAVKANEEFKVKLSEYKLAAKKVEEKRAIRSQQVAALISEGKTKAQAKAAIPEIPAAIPPLQPVFTQPTPQTPNWISLSTVTADERGI